MLWLNSRKDNSGQVHSPSKIQSSDTPQKVLRQEEDAPAEIVFKKPLNITSEHWARVLMFREAALAKNQDVNWYGRVEDQNGQPVVGVVLKMKFMYVDKEFFDKAEFYRQQMGDEIKSRIIELKSDADGNLSVENLSGMTLYVEELTCEGYLWDELTGGANFAYAPHLLPKNASFVDSLKRHRFTMWKKGRAESIIPISARVNMDVTGGGQWISNYFVGFVPGRVEWTNFAGVDLQIRGIRRLSGNPDRPYDFTFILSVPEGGFALSDDVYPYQAPVTGYNSTWSFENKPRLNPPDFPWTKSAYLKLREGKLYAGLKIGFCNGGFDFSFNGYLNPDGSRNLEPDPEKLITDPEEIRRLDEATRVK